MRCLNLSSNASNFRADGSTLHWDFPHLQLEGASKVALSSICLYHTTASSQTIYPVHTSLINADHDNSEGIIACAKFTRQSHYVTYPILEFWNLDYNNPRDILFTFPGIKADDFSFVNIVLVIE